MAVFKKQTIRNERIILDGNEYLDCVLENCELIYSGGLFKFTSTLKNCRWSFDGSALRTVSLLQQLQILPKDPNEVVAIPTEIDKKSAH